MNTLELFSWQSQEPLAVLAAAILQGLMIGLVVHTALKTEKSMTTTCMLLPCVVACALLVINGSLGTGIAILGVFGLVRFRSLPGSGTDILGVFYAMAAGLMASTGYLASALILTLLLGAAFVGISMLSGALLSSPSMVRLSIPEDLADLDGVMNTLGTFGRARLISMKTTHMGTLYELCCEITLDRHQQPAALVDALRQINGNLPVMFYSKMPDAVN